MDTATFWFQGGTADGPNPGLIGQSLRFRGAQQLSRTAATAGDSRTWTISAWVKYAVPNGEGVVWMAGPGTYDKLAFKSGTPHDLLLGSYQGNWVYRLITTQQFRDPSAWMHIVVVSDTNNATASERKRIYINGVRVSAFSVQADPSSGFESFWNSATTHRIGADSNPFYFNGYMAEFHSVDGQALGPETFGEYDANGVWVPKTSEVIRAELNDFVLAPFPANAVDLVDGWDANSTNPDACWSNDYNNANSVTGNSGVTNWTGSIPVPAGTQQITMKIGSGGGSWSPSSGHVIVNGVDVGPRFPVGGTLNAREADITDACGTEITSIRLSSTPSVSNTAFFGLKFDGRIVQTDQNRAVYPEGATPEYMSTGWSFTGNGGNPKNAFNGDLQSATGSSSGTCSWTGNIPVPAGAQVFVHAGSGGGSGSNEAFQINGNQYGNRVPSPFVGLTRIEVTDLVTTGAITSLFLRGTPGVVNAVLTGIEIVDNGVSNIVVEPLTPYGTNGFYLDFSNPDDIGADRSGNGNNFDAIGFELTNIGSRYLPYDWVADSPTNNYSTYNPLDLPTGNIGSANLTHGQPAASYGNARNGFRIPSSGRWALEVQTSGMGSSGTSHWGFAMEGSAYNTATNFNYAATSTGNANPANLSINGTGVGQHTFTSVFRLEVDMDASPPSVETFRGGTSINTQDWTDYDGTSDVYFYTRAVNGSSFAINYGQQPLTNAASAGFQPLSTAELPNVAIRNPSEHFQTILGTGGVNFGTIQYGGDHPTSTRAQHDGRLAVEDGWTGPIFDWAAQVRTDTLNGFDDWYVPSIQETYLLYTVFKSNTGATGYARTSNYTVPPINTSGTTQSVFPEFQDTGSEFIPWYGYHWTMTPSGAGAGIKFYFNDANIDSPSNGGQAQYARLVRREAYTGSEPAVGSAYAGGYLAGFMSDTSGGPANWALIVSPQDGGQYGRTTPILDLAQTTFPNGLWWIKDRDNANQHQLVDSVRGGNLAIRSPAKDGEQAYVAPAGNSVAWCWSAPEVFTPTSPDGLTNLSGRRNLDAGFSIVTYSGSNANASFTHGLNQAPEFRIHAVRNGSGDFPTQHIGYPDANRYQYLTGTGGMGSNSNFWNGQFPDATHAFVGTNGRTNSSGNNYVAYMWHSVPGYSAFGSYVGNGNEDGPFCFTGHRPAFLLIKWTGGGGSTAEDWMLYDVQRNTYNPANQVLQPSATQQEEAPADRMIDVLSNGFKLRAGGQQINRSGANYIYAAFAEHPFGGSNVFPTTAR